MSGERSPFNPKKFELQHQKKQNLINRNQHLLDINRRLNNSIYKSQEIYDYSNIIICGWNNSNNPIIEKGPYHLFKKIGVKQDEVLGTNLASLFSSNQDNQNKLHLYLNNLRSRQQLDPTEAIVGEFQLSSGKWVELDSKQFINEDKQKKFYIAIHDIDHHIQTINELQINPVTGLLNRTAFNQELDIIKEDRRNRQYSFLFIDLDNLKIGNDLNGHGFGDELLKQTAKLLNENCRDTDKIFHLGGDEFIIYSPISQDQAEELAVRLKKQASEVKINGKHNNLDKFIPLPLHFSIGVASRFPSSSQTPEEILEAADIQMYQNKRNHKNNPDKSVFKFIMDHLKTSDTNSVEFIQVIKKNLDFIGKINNLSEEKLSQLSLLAQLYQIGKYSILDRHIYKNQIFNSQKMNEMYEQINNLVFKIASDSIQCRDVAHYSNKFFENWDGTGPNKLSKNNIPKESRIFRIALAASVIQLKNFDLTTELSKLSGTILDPNLVDNYLKNLNNN